MSVHLLTFSLSQDQTKPLELDLTFDLDRLPVAFGTALSMKDGNLDRKPLNDTMREIARVIWKIGGFRFGHKRTDWDRLKFVYYCCQDADRAYASVTQGKQDTPRMERFKCQSKLTLKPSLEERTLPVLQSTAFFRCHPIHPGSGYHEDVGRNLPRTAEFKATRLGTRNPWPSILPVAEFEFEYMATRL
jgi:hypothetical protein